MAVQTTNVAALYFGTTNYVKGITSLIEDDPENVPRYSDALSDSAPVLLTVGPPQSGRAMTLEVEIDSTDTNGQVALDTAKTSKAKITGAIYYPYGKVTGNPQKTGDIYVLTSGSTGSTGNTSKARKKQYKLLWAAEPTPGTVP
jgi:hypothetical protein